MAYSKLNIPQAGAKIDFKNDTLIVPDNPIIPYIEGDGIGPDIWAATQRVLDAAVEKAYGGKKKIHWMEILIGEKAEPVYGEYIPEDTLEAVKDFRVAIKGPLTTPVGGGMRSFNVALRQLLDLYACVRPVRYFKGVPSPVKEPEKMDVIIFRENTEDVYAGIEWEEGSVQATNLIYHLKTEMGKEVAKDSGLGVKPISRTASQNLIRKAIQWAIAKQLPSVTLMHKGNIMKFTEGAFRKWGYELAAEEFGDKTITEDQLWEQYDGKRPEGMVVIKDRIADSMFQQILLRTAEYSVIATPNLNGDYISDAAAAQVGGLGMAPGGNVGDGVALFEATHGTAPKYAGLDKVNPSSLILSGVMMLQYLGWDEAGDMIHNGIEAAIQNKKVTYDLARQMEGATKLKCSEFATEIIRNLK